MEVIEVLKREKEPRVSVVKMDEFTAVASKAFDYKFEGTSEFYGWQMPTNLPKNFNIGVIIGSSGSGKSTLLSKFGKEEKIEWNDDAIVSNFETPDDAINRLTAVGLNSIPSWVRPYKVLSTGEKFRADLARRIKDNAVVDEFTSVVNRQVAKSTSVAVSKYIRKNNINGVVFASCHDDIIEWLEPDWVLDTNAGVLYDGRSLRRPQINIQIYPCERNLWSMFSSHHYLTPNINTNARAFVAVWDGEIVGFESAIPMPSGTIKNAWREHRLVVLPDYQGMGIGTRLSDAVAEIMKSEGKRYYSRTAHPRLGEYRDKSPKWKKTSKYKKKRTDIDPNTHRFCRGTYAGDSIRICYSHEYVGE